MTKSPWLPFVLPSPGTAVRLFCFPHGGGGASGFQSWRGRVAPGVEVCAVQPPGRETRWGERPFTALPDLVAALEDGLAPWFDRPFALFGHSLGGLVAFELARRLQSAGRAQPLRLFLSGARAPQRPPPRRGSADWSDTRFVAKLRRLGTVPAEVLDQPELLEVVLPVLRADFALYEAYRFEPGAPLAVPFSVFGGEADELVRPEELAGWEDLTAAECRLRLFPGGHFFLRESREAVLAAIAGDLGSPAMRADAGLSERG